MTPTRQAQCGRTPAEQKRLVEIVRRSRSEQGLPECVSDEPTLQRVAAIIAKAGK